MRKLSAITITVAAVFALSGVAQAAVQSNRTLTITQTSTKAGASTGLTLGLLTNTTPSGLTPDIGSHDDIFLHKGMTYNGRYYPQCNKARLAATGQPSVCRSALIGSGRIVGLLHKCGTNPPLTGSSDSPTTIPIALYLFNGTGGTHQYALLTAPPTVTNVIGHPVLDISISRVSGRFGLKEVFNVPNTLVQPVPGACASLADVRLTITKKTVTVKRRVRGRTVTTHPGLLVNGPCPSNRQWYYRDTVRFVSAPGVVTRTTNGDKTLTCRR